MKLLQYFVFLSFLTCLACKSDSNNTKFVEEDETFHGKQMFEKINPSSSNIQFSNTIKEDINFHHLNWESVYNGGGVATADFNNDGLLDIFFTGNQVNDALYKNDGNFTFTDVSTSSKINTIPGWSTGVAIADVNNDGLQDIYVSRMWHAKDGKEDLKRKNLLWINKGNFVFEEKASEYGIANMGHSTQASFFDYDKDGDLDLYVLNAPSNNYSQKLVYINANSIPDVHLDRLYRNDGNKFTDVTIQAGVKDYGFGLGLVTVDMNNDGWTDIYVANDFDRADRMFINQKDGTFKDEIQSYLKHISFSSMGTDIADLNNDNRTEIAVLDMRSADHYRSKTNMPSMDAKQFWTNVARGQHYQYMSNALQLNNGSGYYSEIAQLAGISSTDWSWSILLADFDQDQYKDIFVTNGINKDIRNNDFSEKMKVQKINNPKELFEFSQQVPSQPISNIIYKNNPDKLHFDKMNASWGATDKGYSYGASYADLDNDGDLDLVVNNNNSVASVYKNTNNGNYLTVQVRKNKIPYLNTVVNVYQNGKVQRNEIATTRGFQSSVTPWAHFGVGQAQKIDSIEILMPSGERYFKKDVAINQTLELDYEKMNLSSPRKNSEQVNTAFKDISTISGITYRHKENPFDDFEKEILLPHKQSTKGPYMAVADINNDGFDDFYVGNSHNAAGELYLGNDKGFTKSKQADFENDKLHEDQGAAFIDINNDGLLDLYVVSGGSEKPLNNMLYQDRVYINNNGTFKRTLNLPSTKANGSQILVHDFNGDGKMDLFVGGRAKPNQYPAPAKSQLLINENGQLVDKTDEYNKELSSIGIVTDAGVIDLNGDGIKDLIVVGEFMKPQVFINDQSKMVNQTADYMPNPLNGWFYSIEFADLDQDGTMEILLGNAGNNNKFAPTKKKPLKIYGNDFDKNNQTDIVLTKVSEKYGEVPVRGRECSSQQMPFIKNKFKDFDKFASADISDIYGEKNLKNSIKLEANNFLSGYLKKKGTSYEFIPFPTLAQISTIKDMAVYDFDQDGDMDIIFVGNMFNSEVETVRYDSSIGGVLENVQGTLQFKEFNETGWYTPGNARQVKLVKLGDEIAFLVTNNSFITQLIKTNR